MKASEAAGNSDVAPAQTCFLPEARDCAGRVPSLHSCPTATCLRQDRGLTPSALPPRAFPLVWTHLLRPLPLLPGPSHHGHTEGTELPALASAPFPRIPASPTLHLQAPPGPSPEHSTVGLHHFPLLPPPHRPDRSPGSSPPPAPHCAAPGPGLPLKVLTLPLLAATTLTQAHLYGEQFESHLTHLPTSKLSYPYKKIKKTTFTLCLLSRR